MGVSAGPKIVETNILFALDMANIRSFPSTTGSYWYDIGIPRNSGYFRRFLRYKTNATYVTDNGGAWDFGGGNSWIEDVVGGHDYLNGLTACTIEAWVKSDITSTDNGIFHTQTPDGSDVPFTLRYDATGFDGGASNTVKFAVGPDTATLINSEGSAGIQTTDWQCLIMTWSTTVNSGKPELYVNGQKDTPTNNDAQTSAISGVARILIGVGSKNTVSSNSWDGKIAIIRLYNKKLTDAEVLQNFNALKGRFGL